MNIKNNTKFTKLNNKEISNVSGGCGGFCCGLMVGAIFGAPIGIVTILALTLTYEEIENLMILHSSKSLGYITRLVIKATDFTNTTESAYNHIACMERCTEKCLDINDSYD